MNDDAPRATGVAMLTLLDDAAQRSATYLHSLGQRPVRPDPAAVQQLARLDEALPESPTDPAGVLALLDEVVSPATMATAGPRFFGFVIGGSLPAALAANWLVGAWDQNACLAKVTPGVAQVEAVALRWLVDMLGLPPQTEGSFVTGATLAVDAGGVDEGMDLVARELD
jgi:glutamate/tyrosine decarboxylase-like PLP-dependent enzyme